MATIKRKNLQSSCSCNHCKVRPKMQTPLLIKPQMSSGNDNATVA